MSDLPARFPFLVASLGMALLTGMDGLAKALAGSYPTLEIVFMRFAGTAVLVGAGAALLRQGRPARGRLAAHLGRAVLMVVTTSSFFYALGRLPLADVFALTFTSPMFIALFAAVFLREPIRAAVALGIGIGFVGVLVIVFGPGQAAMDRGRPPLALAAALVSPVTYALGIVLLKAQTAKEPLGVIIAVQAAFVCLLLAPVAPFAFVMPSADDWAMVAALGALGALGYVAFASGLKYLPAGQFSLVEYTGLLWAAAIGFIVFAETPPPSLWLGAALIILACVIVLRQRPSA